MPAVQPQRRLLRLLTEIHKRTLSEQSLLISFQYKEREFRVLASAPASEPPMLADDILWELTRKAVVENRLLLLGDLTENQAFDQECRMAGVKSVLACPVHDADGTSDVLILLNYSSLGGGSRIIDLVPFAVSILSLAVHNHRLYIELQKKDVELHGWTAHIEQRIEEGTKKLLERELQYHSLFEGANDGIVVHDRDGRLLEANRVACRLFGYDRKEFMTLGLERLAEARHADDLRQFFDRIHQNEIASPVEMTLVRKNGTTFPAELSSRRVKFIGREAIQTFVRDITVRRTLEEGLREEREKYRILVDSSLLGVFILEHGTIRFANRKFAEMLGSIRDELIGTSFFDRVDPEDRGMVSSRESQREAGDDVESHYEARFRRADDTLCWCEMHCCRVVIDGVPSVMGNAIDISQRKQWENQTLDAQKMESIGTLAGGIAHDFNNLLGGILGYASLILSELKEDDPYYQDLRAIAETAKRAADLTGQLLAFARGGKYQVSTLRIPRIASDVLAILATSIDRSTVIETHFDENLWAVRGDSRQIHQTFMNICMNSVDAMPGGGVLTFSAGNVVLDETSAERRLGVKPGEYVRVSIRDTGYGMDEKTKARVFEPFFTTKPTNEGRGLGLSMVYGIVKNHGGSVHVESERGRGTEVVLFFPRHPEAEAEARLTSEASNPSAVLKKILLVDDEEIIRQVGSRMLRKKGFDVILAENGKDALDIYETRKQEISVVILDLIMPEMGGKETYHKLIAMDPHVKVVFTSGYGPDDRPDLMDGLKVNFLQKPFHTEVLCQTIMKTLANGSDSA
jgi:two-component system, cell cycle sensor histidine kinase and response regulator CckA